MAMSNYEEQKVANHAYGGTAWVQPTSWVLALYNTDPADDGLGTEVTGGGYARTAFTPTIGATPDFIISNAGDIVFPTATGNWTTANFVAIYDNLGNMLDYGALTTPRTILTDGVFKIPAGQLSVQFA